MKNYIYILLALIIISCSEDPQSDSLTLNNLQIHKIEKHLPLEHLAGKSQAIFVNSSGDEKVLNLNITEETVSRRIGEKTYEAERIIIDYTDPLSTEYSMYIDASGNYLKENDPNLFISCGLTQFVTGYIPLITISESGNPILAQYFDNQTLSNISFEKVFANHQVDGYLSYGRIYYNTKLGVIGFLDKNGELYALQEVKK